ncbi:MAG TPA: GYD domain-containing protein [Geopsychrobacteraceae bacterium]|jgi:uncharacterized protein with GYD domain
MLTFIMLTRLSSDALHSPKSLEELEQQIMKQIHSECPQVKWVHNYAVLGGCDYLDIFEAPDLETAMKVSTIIRTYGHANTEIWSAKDWKGFKKIIRDLPGGKSYMPSGKG